ncbi:hypothetical protein HDF16_002825 [Granulicella aggregans]|uniref:Uncharacterized protein n=1 Tax=Granulicella aggregans TaxID=474949 RepID=A0A7W7ZDX0_9BACT|nr:hypothetical protein [Granulicella aggregans]MBB5058119.1 hypothetical protein [Granulicella aggregans]
MKLKVKVSAAVAYDGKAIIGVGGLDEGRQNHTAGGNAIKDQGIDIVGAEDHGKIGSRERTDSMLGDDDLVTPRRNDVGDGPEWCPEELLMLFRSLDGTKQRIASTDFGQPWAKAYLNMDDRHPNGTSMTEDLCGSTKESVLGIAGVDGEDADLAIHAQQGCARGINRQRVCHSQAPLALSPAAPEF